ncbi:MAG: VWA domain-containing protein [Candidatus Omnitrophica bacterium]|jgi:Ca-activated chloride channel family protein|nr:VWA domain-containing protein [Candidatus Omnitrophota bacterium]MDD5253245.1 VWA domain-containing protein [Candidatus Omnitrophota bacterium]
MSLHNPFVLILIPIAILFFLYKQKKQSSESGFKFSSGELVSKLRDSFKLKLSQNLIYLRMLAVVLLILALARPQIPIADSKIQSEGIDIVLAIDCSTSMLAEDFKLGGGRQNRLEVVKSVVKDFIMGRRNDRIAIVAFAARAYTVCPLTLDYGWLLDNLDRVKTGMVEDGTAIGSGVATSLNRLKESKGKSKVVILLTDGRNNTGKISPLTAAEAAQALKIKVYTIGAGSKGPVPYPVQDFFGNTVYQPVEIDIDEDTLMKIADMTGGKYFRATDTESLRKIYKEIDTLEKTVIEEKGYLEYNELFSLFLILSLVFLFLDIVLSNTILRKIP